MSNDKQQGTNEYFSAISLAKHLNETYFVLLNGEETLQELEETLAELEELNS